MSNLDIENKLNNWLSDSECASLIDNENIIDALYQGIIKTHFEFGDIREIINYIQPEIPLNKIFSNPKFEVKYLTVLNIMELYQYNQLDYIISFQTGDKVLWFLFAYIFNYSDLVSNKRFKLSLSAKPIELGYLKVMEDSIEKRAIQILPTKYNVNKFIEKDPNDNSDQLRYELEGGNNKALLLAEETIIDYLKAMYDMFINKNIIIED